MKSDSEFLPAFPISHLSRLNRVLIAFLDSRVNSSAFGAGTEPFRAP